MSEILNKYKRWKPIFVMDRSRCDDFVLSLATEAGDAVDGQLTKKCLISYIDMTDPKCVLNGGGAVSLEGYTYPDAINDGYELYDIGLTGTDNGMIRFDKNIITDEEYIEILTGSTLSITSGDTRLYMFPVTGNTGNYDYPTEYHEGDSGDTYYSFKGGFLQGVYKGFGYDYQVLPQYVEDAFSLEFVLRPRTDYEETGNTINNTNGGKNSGTFFYIGTRSENKFSEFYDYDMSEFPKRDDVMSGWTADSALTTSEDHTTDTKGNPDIFTDNGYLIYSRAKDGFTVKTWKQGDTLRIVDNSKHRNENLYLYLNHAPGGYTVKTIDNIPTEPEPASKVTQDTINNAFALKINEDYSIGYKYMVLDCDGKGNVGTVEERSLPNMITPDVWNTVHVKFSILDENLDECGKPASDRTMKIYIYVNGYLKFVSKELPELKIRELDEKYEKQEFVPFNISLGGGTQGLMESTWIGSYNGFPYILPIEENFAGSFIGDIRSFKIYGCHLYYNDIKNNFLFENGGGQTMESIVKDTLIYYGFGISPADVIEHGKTMRNTYELMTRLTDKAKDDYSKFYFIVSSTYKGKLPVAFTCGNAPMVMDSSTKVLFNKLCAVYTSGEVYGKDTELTVVTDNF